MRVFLPDEVLLNILSRNDDFISLLAAMGVSQQWRECTRWVKSLVVHCPTLLQGKCKVHALDLLQLNCDCVRHSLRSFLDRSLGLTSFTLADDVLSVTRGLLFRKLFNLHDKPDACFQFDHSSDDDDDDHHHHSVDEIDIPACFAELRMLTLINPPFDSELVVECLQRLFYPLEKLKLEKLRALNDYHLGNGTGGGKFFSAPKLVSLEWYSEHEQVWIFHAPNLRELIIDGNRWFSLVGNSLLKKVVAGNNVQLDLDLPSVEDYEITGFWYHSWLFPNLRQVSRTVKRLRVSPTDLNGIPHVQEAFEKMPVLEELEINVTLLKMIRWDETPEAAPLCRKLQKLALDFSVGRRFYKSYMGDETQIASLVCRLLFWFPASRLVLKGNNEYHSREAVKAAVYQTLEATNSVMPLIEILLDEEVDV